MVEINVDKGKSWSLALLMISGLVIALVSFVRSANGQALAGVFLVLFALVLTVGVRRSK